MATPIHRNVDSRSCGATTTVQLQSNVFANELLVAVQGDPNSHGSGELISGANQVFVNNILVIRLGDSASADNLCPPLGGEHCSPNASSASPTVFAGFPTQTNVGTPASPTIAYNMGPRPTASVADEPDSISMSGSSPGGGSIAPTEDGGPMADSGSAPDAISSEPSACTRPDLGKLSEKYESNGNPAAIGNDTGGGYSYGSYQIATKTGTFVNYMTFVQNKYTSVYARLSAAGGEPAARTGIDQFKQEWRAATSDPNFAKSQHDFIQATHYDKQVHKIKGATGIDVCDGTHSAALQDAIWSTAVQHGPGTSIVVKAIAAAGPGATDKQIIAAIYDERSKVSIYFPRLTDRERTSVANRFTRERVDALA